MNKFRIFLILILIVGFNNCKSSSQSMNNKKLTEQDILHTLDLSNDGYYCSFVEFDQGYSYLIDSRLNVFRGENENWAIVIERLGYNPRADAIILEIYYFGNCLMNLESYNNRPTNYYQVFPIDNDSFRKSVEIESLKPNAESWLVRGKNIPLSHNKQDYIDAGIKLKEYEPNEISVEEAARLIVLSNNDILRATDDELYKSIPKNLKKIMVLDEWYHKDFSLLIMPNLTKDHLKQTYNLNKSLTGLDGMTLEEFVDSYKKNVIMNNVMNKEIWENNRPSSYETWQQIAKVIEKNNPDLYKPTLKPNTHWKNWPESGNL